MQIIDVESESSKEMKGLDPVDKGSVRSSQKSQYGSPNLNISNAA